MQHLPPAPCPLPRPTWFTDAALSWYAGQRYLEVTPYDGGEQWRPTMAKPEGCTTVFVGNMSFDVTEECIREAFGDCGTIVSVRWGTDKESGDFRGFCHLSFDASAAVDKVRRVALNCWCQHSPHRRRQKGIAQCPQILYLLNGGTSHAVQAVELAGAICMGRPLKIDYAEERSFEEHAVE